MLRSLNRPDILVVTLAAAGILMVTVDQITGRELFEDYAGSMRDGFKLRPWQPGGAGTGFLLPEHLDAQMYAGGIAKVGTRMGTGLAFC